MSVLPAGALRWAMPPRTRPLTEADRTAWGEYARHVRVFSGRQPPVTPSAPPATPQTARPAAPSPVRTLPAPRGDPAALVTGLAPAGLDRASWGRFRGGKMTPARTLDLHGKTAQAAFHALERFLVNAHAERLRCVEVITGRGSGEQGGVIRRELPHWLNLPSLRPLVLAAAHPHPQNAGSTRLLLRRTRP